MPKIALWTLSWTLFRKNCRDLLCNVSHIITTVHFDFGRIPDDNIIARNASFCLLAVRMNFGVPIEFCVRQIVMGKMKKLRSDSSLTQLIEIFSYEWWVQCC